MKYATALLLFLAIALPTHMSAQFIKNAELSGGWAYSTGDFGLSGFNVGGALWFTNRISVGIDFDRVGNNKSLPIFALTNAGIFVTKSTLYNWMIGPRFSFGSKRIKILQTINPFAEVEVGASHLSSSVSTQNLGSTSASDNAGSWLVGGGADILFSPRWAVRTNFDYLRTHFVDQGQNRVRIMLGVAYTFRGRKVQ
jgi:opacity protein-like surface antigen